jgi:hypothetical protein
VRPQWRILRSLENQSMNTMTWKLAAVATVLCACSSGGHAGGDGFDPAGGSSSSGGTGSSGGATNSSGGGSGGSSGGSSGTSSGGSGGGITRGADAGPYIPADASVKTNGYDASVPSSELDTPVTLTMSAFTVNPNSEVFKCQQFGNPWGKDTDIVKLDGYMDQGSHHFFLFNMDPTTLRTQAAAIGDCPGAGIEFHPFPYLSQTYGHYIVTFPEPTMGYPLVKANGLMMNAHYLNAGTSPMTPTVTITIYPAKDGVVTTHVGSIFLNNTAFGVPKMTLTPTWYPKTQTPITAEDYTIISHWSHMHKYSTDFQASSNNAMFYEEKSWDEPQLINQAMDPMHLLPMHMKAGSSITWQCLYTNPTSSDMNFGDSAQTNVMCIYIGQYYPADTTSPSYPDIVSVLN